MSKIFIQSIPSPFNVYGLNKLSDPDTGTLLRKSNYGNTYKRLQALYSGRIGGLLNHISYRPWLDENGKQKFDDRGLPFTLQDREEIKWSMPKGYLTNKSWKRGDSLNERDLTYFQKTYWKLNDGSTVLDLDNFDDCMFYYVALDSKFIANSEKELRENKSKWAYATHFIALQNESDEIQYETTKRKVKAYATLEDKAFTKVWKEKFLHILELSSFHTVLTEEQIENTLYKFIESDSRSNGNIDKFMFLFGQLKSDDGRKALNARHLLRKALETRVIFEKSDTYTWNRNKGPIVLGDTYDETIVFLLNPAKEVLLEELENEIKAKLM